ncbi:MAG: metallophosphoesterase, partial [Clostridiaceae bacterium]|nr:metallophosphoesterase [Clostridiaceae bacterium]
EAFAVFDSFMQDSAAAGAKYIFLAGDLSNSGTAEQHKMLASYLETFESANGVKVFVVPGNHDYYGLKTEPVAAFREIYKNAGFSDAYAVDEKTNSYAVDLDGGYTLLAIDPIKPGNNAGEIGTELLSWIETQAKAATARGRKLIGMMHHPFIPHFSMQEKMINDSLVKNWKTLETKFADLGIQYVFTGHKHSADIGKFTSDASNVTFDIGVPSLLNYPLAYRFVSFLDNKVEVREKNVTSIKNPLLLPDGYNEEALLKVTTNTQKYAEEVFAFSLKDMFNSFLNANRLCKLIGKEDEGLKEIFETVCEKTKYLADLPLYGEGETIETIAKNYNLTLPASDYKTGFELLLAIFKVYCTGDENFSSNSVEMQLGLRCIAILLNYSLEGTSSDTKVLFLEAMTAAFGGDITGTSVALTAIVLKYGDDFGIEVVSAFLKPILEDIFVDSEPGDRNVDLPAYYEIREGNELTKTLTFFEKIALFFLKAWNYIKGIFSAVKI